MKAPPVLTPLKLSRENDWPVRLKLTLRALSLLFKAENRRIRKEKCLTFGDALFNFRRIASLQATVLRYRNMVRFGDQVVLDGVFPPFQSPAFDKKLSNYINNLDLQEIPSGIVSISTTNCCPYACAFCSTDAHRNPDNDLDEDLLKKTIRQVEGLQVPTMILHGGEPMLRYDRFLRLVRHVSHDICLWMFTAGYGVTAERALELRQSGIFGAWISLDHHDPQIHNRLRGHPDAFDNACNAGRPFQTSRRLHVPFPGPAR